MNAYRVMRSIKMCVCARMCVCECVSILICDIGYTARSSHQPTWESFDICALKLSKKQPLFPALRRVAMVELMRHSEWYHEP
jgi:hypothetical protein